MHAFLRTTPLALALCAAALGHAQTLGKHAQAYKGPQGQTVLVAPTADDQKALVQISGVNAPIDGVVFLADKITEGERVLLRSQIDGSAWNLLRSEQRYGGTASTAFVPGLRDGLALHFDEKTAKATDPQALKATYEKQRKAGVQERLARFDRPKRVAALQKELERTDADAAQACGGTVTTQVDWDPISDTLLQRLSVSGYCGAVADALRRMCTSDAAFKPNAAAYGQIQCSFGTRLRLRQEGGKTVFTTTEDAPNQDEFALQYLRNQ